MTTAEQAPGIISFTPRTQESGDAHGGAAYDIPGYNKAILIPDSRFVYDSEGISYELGGTLARTPNSRLIHAVDMETGERKVMKFASRDHVEAEHAALQSMAGHPNVLNLAGSGIFEGTKDHASAVITDFVPGSNLANFIPKTSNEATIEHFGKVIDPVLDSLDVVQALHAQGKVMRDYKPGQIIVTPEAKGVTCDLQTVVREGDDTAIGNGTFRYMPPESFFEEAQKSSDIYAVGVSIAALLAGMRGDQKSATTVPMHMTPELVERHIHELAGGKRPVDLAAVYDIAPTPLAEVVDAAMEPMPEDRATLEEIKDALEDTRDMLLAA